MTTLAARPVTAEFSLSDTEFQAIADRAHREFGLSLPKSKKELVIARLAKRLRALDLKDFASYCALLERPDSAAERLEMLSALTTNVTHFFREPHHFQLLETRIIPENLERIRSGGRYRIWSAGCSAGQEPYSIATSLRKIFPDVSRFDVKILATDIDPAILARAKAGIYPDEDRAAIPPDYRNILIGESVAEGHFSVSNQVRELISFGPLNLMSDWPMRGQFDVIFCRNVAIYFDKSTQARLWKRFHDLLHPGGYLIIGHSERVPDETDLLFESVGITALQKTGPVGTTRHTGKKASWD